MAGKPSASRRPSSLGRTPSTPTGDPSQAGAALPHVSVPSTNKDPVWSLCPWSAEIILDRDITITVPPVPAVDWLKFLLTPEFDIVSMVEELMPGLDDYYFENELPLIDYSLRILEVISTVAARPWWIAFRLIGVATSNWHIIGPKLTINGVDATRISLAAWLDTVLFLAIESMDPKDVTMFSMKLEAPLPQHIAEALGGAIEQEEITMDRSAFMSMAF